MMNQSAYNEKSYSVILHLAPFVWLFFPWLGNVLAPFILWYSKRKNMPYVNYHGKEVLNFQLWVSLIGYPLYYATPEYITPYIINIFTAFIIGVMLWSCYKAGKGVKIKYPLPYRFIK